MKNGELAKLSDVDTVLIEDLIDVPKENRHSATNDPKFSAPASPPSALSLGRLRHKGPAMSFRKHAFSTPPPVPVGQTDLSESSLSESSSPARQNSTENKKNASFKKKASSTSRMTPEARRQREEQLRVHRQEKQQAEDVKRRKAAAIILQSSARRMFAYRVYLELLVEQRTPEQVLKDKSVQWRRDVEASARRSMVEHRNASKAGYIGSVVGKKAAERERARLREAREQRNALSSGTLTGTSFTESSLTKRDGSFTKEGLRSASYQALSSALHHVPSTPSTTTSVLNLANERDPAVGRSPRSVHFEDGSLICDKARQDMLYDQPPPLASQWTDPNPLMRAVEWATELVSPRSSKAADMATATAATAARPPAERLSSRVRRVSSEVFQRVRRASQEFIGELSA